MIVWIDEQTDHPRGGDKLVQQFQPLRRYLHDQRGYACHIGAWPVKTGN
jgi:hypothetical protein